MTGFLIVYSEAIFKWYKFYQNIITGYDFTINNCYVNKYKE
jgi:hypothetical protein